MHSCITHIQKKTHFGLIPGPVLHVNDCSDHRKVLPFPSRLSLPPFPLIFKDGGRLERSHEASGIFRQNICCFLLGPSQQRRGCLDTWDQAGIRQDKDPKSVLSFYFSFLWQFVFCLELDAWINPSASKEKRDSDEGLTSWCFKCDLDFCFCSCLRWWCWQRAVCGYCWSVWCCTAGWRLRLLHPHAPTVRPAATSFLWPTCLIGSSNTLPGCMASPTTSTPSLWVPSWPLNRS